MNAHGIRFQGTCFWVLHRRREYGPFDYEWARDLGGVELLFAGEKFGEYCSPAEIYADLKSFELPKVVSDVGSIVLGCIIFGILNGLDTSARHTLIHDRLNAGGYARFTQQSFVDGD